MPSTELKGLRAGAPSPILASTLHQFVPSRPAMPFRRRQAMLAQPLSALAWSAGPGAPVDPSNANSSHAPSGDEEAGVKTVLVVDDDVSVRRVAAKVLLLGGYRVMEAGSGAEALELADAAEGRIGLLLTDVVMPTTNGRELAEALLDRYPHIRVLFMSGYTEDEVILQGVRVAEVNFISKPFSVEGLRRTVRELLEDSA